MHYLIINHYCWWGDIDQLPLVEPGNVLSDIIHSQQILLLVN
ncbi:MAG: hypothetical protein ACTS78_00475 [Arsenophonus sp. NC-WZS1-MAG3]